jgi:TfoX/Sxy family transcriptional regulator of competence genes
MDGTRRTCATRASSTIVDIRISATPFSQTFRECSRPFFLNNYYQIESKLETTHPNYLTEQKLGLALEAVMVAVEEMARRMEYRLGATVPIQELLLFPLS